MLIVGQREEVAAFSRLWDHHWTAGVVFESDQRIREGEREEKNDFVMNLNVGSQIQ